MSDMDTNWKSMGRHATCLSVIDLIQMSALPELKHLRHVEGSCV